MKGRAVVIALLLTLVAFVGFVFWLGATGGGTARNAQDAAPSRGSPGPAATRAVPSPDVPPPRGAERD